MWPPSGEGSIPAPEKNFEPVLSEFKQASGAPKKKQDKGLASLSPPCPDTSARSADSLRGFSVESEVASVEQGFTKIGVIVPVVADISRNIGAPNGVASVFAAKILRSSSNIGTP